MKRLIFTLLSSLTALTGLAQHTDTIYLTQPATPLLINRQNNVALELRVTPNATHQPQKLNTVTIRFSESTPLKYIKAVTLYYSGTGRVADGANFDNPSYNILRSKTNKVSQEVTLAANQSLFPAANYFWVGLTLDPKTPLGAKFSISISDVLIDNHNATLAYNGITPVERRAGISVRHGGDDGVNAYRIPGLVTSKKGTLLAVYDVRRNNSVDLQEDIQIGLSRSFDNGQTWRPMQLAVDMRGMGGLPDNQNGVGDPAILVDDKTGDLWIMGLYTHGIGNKRSWNGCVFGAMTPEEQAAQVVIARSTDDGATWSTPINITSQVKLPEWGILLQGPGMGITMQDGTLVFAFQYRDKEGLPNATIIYSRDQGKNWTVGSAARGNTTEAQVVELAPGTLMLNMRDNRGGSRAVAITNDLGKSWTEHSSSRSALIEPVCMASLIKSPASGNATGKDVLLFSNPADTRSRTNITIKASTDGGKSWNGGVLLDNGATWGYSCLTMIDPATVGILYEGSQSQMTFQAVALQDILEAK